ncbi:MAG: hypothetical protein IPJ46_12450 [Anaerolineales bacterium]|nr:hypothetical protein [Anaerolineales bacterium]
MTAQVVVRCISKVADAYKLDRKVKRTFKPHGAIAFDDRILTYKLDRMELSLWTVEGRQRCPLPAENASLNCSKASMGKRLVSGQR